MPTNFCCGTLYETYNELEVELHIQMANLKLNLRVNCKNGKGFPYSLPSVGPGAGADPGVQADRQQVTVSHPPGGRLPLLSVRPAVTFPAAEHHRPLAVPCYTAW